MEAAIFSKMLVTTYQTTWYYNPEEHNLNYDHWKLRFYGNLFSLFHDPAEHLLNSCVTYLFVHMKQLKNHWPDFQKISYWVAFVKFVDTFQFGLKLDKNNSTSHVTACISCVSQKYLSEWRIFQIKVVNERHILCHKHMSVHLSVFEINKRENVYRFPIL
jgi:hypothetical protein